MSEPMSVGAGPRAYESVMHDDKCDFAGLDYDYGTQDCCAPILRERERRERQLMEEAQKNQGTCARCGARIAPTGNCSRRSEGCQGGRGELSVYEPPSEQTLAAPDLVNHPPHYKSGGMEVIDIIEAFDLDFCLGNTVKYVLRAGKKTGESTLHDLLKAQWYINRAVSQAKKRGQP